MKRVFKLAVLLVVLGQLPLAQAQFIYTRPIVGGPNSRPGGLPISPYNQLYYGSPALVPRAIQPGMMGGPFGTTGLRPGIGVGMGTEPLGSTHLGTTGSADPALGGSSLTNSAQDLNQGFVTGHPVAFQNYRGYFLNLNAAAGAATQGYPGGGTPLGTSPIGLTNFGFLGTQTNIPGTRPKRGKENLERGR